MPQSLEHEIKTATKELDQSIKLIRDLDDRTGLSFLQNTRLDEIYALVCNARVSLQGAMELLGCYKKPASDERPSLTVYDGNNGGEDHLSNEYVDELESESETRRQIIDQLLMVIGQLNT